MGRGCSCTGRPAGWARRFSSWGGRWTSHVRDLLRRDFAAVERLGAVAIDYRNEDFLARMRELTGGEGVDVVLDGFGGALSIRSFRALRPGGRLVVFGHSGTVAHGRKSWRGWINWYATTATVSLWGLLSPRRRVLVYRIQKLREGHQWLPVSGRHRAPPVGGGPRDPDWFREDFSALLRLLREDKIHPVVAERLPLSDAVARMSCSRARRTRESSCSCRSRTDLGLEPPTLDDWVVRLASLPLFAQSRSAPATSRRSVLAVPERLGDSALPRRILVSDHRDHGGERDRHP